MKVLETIVTKSPDETILYARRFARSLKPGAVIALEGDLGSGKTTFVKGVALGLGLPSADQVKSPTFVLMHVYDTKIPLYHFDLYRLESADELAAIGFEEYVGDPAAISCIEWAEKSAGLLPEQAYRVSLSNAGADSRKIVVNQ